MKKYAERLQKENEQLKQDVEKLAHNMIVQDIYNSKIVQQLKDKDEKISKVIEYCNKEKNEYIEDNDISTITSYGVATKVLNILESNKED